MNAKQLIYILEDDGWYFEREGKGSHKIFKHHVKKGIISIPYHGKKDLGKGLVRKIFKQAKL